MDKIICVPIYKAPVIDTLINWYNTFIGVRGKYFMECPRCGEEITDGTECKKCRKGAVPPKEMEIQYKEFKISELLDIRMTSHISSGEEIKKSEFVPEKGDGSNRAARASKEPYDKKTLLVVTVVISLLAVIAGFYLLRFLF